MTRPRLLDAFSGAGGAARGYQMAGFHVTGVDHVRQPRYAGDVFVQADAVEYIAEHGWEYDAIHASPPCQAYTQLAKGEHPRLIEPVRDALISSDVPWVIENVVGAPLRGPLLLCGSMFGLGVRRHRLFETPVWIMQPSCNHDAQKTIRAYYGKKGWLAYCGRKPLLRGSVDLAEADMGIGWMQTWDELREAIPPAYTEYVGTRLRTHLEAAA